jgi:hypothetical protein
MEYPQDRAARTQSFFSALAHAFSRRTLQALRHLLLETELFLGTALVAIGFLSFESDKYCDGNTADYLSCTRPSTYYYFDWLDIALIIAGIFFIFFWLLKTREERRK